MFSGVSFDYGGTRVLVTGGSNGIGLACAKAYAGAGANVIITGRKANASDYGHDLSGFGYRQVDVDSREQLMALAAGLDGLGYPGQQRGRHPGQRVGPRRI